MPKLIRRAPSSIPDATSKGRLAQETDTWEVPDILDASQAVNMQYMCRAFSEINRPGSHANEDRFFCEEHLDKSRNLVDMFIVGVIDGHDGEVAANLVVDNLPSQIFNHCFLDHKRVSDAHELGFAAVEKNLKTKNSTSGCCVNSCVVWGRYLWCANLGDCRALYIPLNEHTNDVFQPKEFVWMSRDLKGSTPSEQERIRKAGWRVQDGRVEGLEPTRTIGDFDVKEKVPKDVISIVPETRTLDLLDETANVTQGLLIQGTDGVWDVVVGADILNILKARHKQVRTLQKYLANFSDEFDPEHGVAVYLERIAQDIVTLALTKGSNDDCTAIITAVSMKKKK